MILRAQSLSQLRLLTHVQKISSDCLWGMCWSQARFTAGTLTCNMGNLIFSARYSGLVGFQLKTRKGDFGCWHSRRSSVCDQPLSTAFINMEEDWEDLSSEGEEEIIEQQLIYGEDQEPSELEPEILDGLTNGLKRARRGDMEDEEEMGFVNSAYDMMHRLNLEWPSLSCDFIVSRIPTAKRPPMQELTYPAELCCIAGSQAPKSSQLYLLVCKNLHRTKYDDDSINMGDQQSDSQNEPEPILHRDCIPLRHSPNRIRCLNYSPIVALWSENAEVMILNLMRRYDGVINKERSKDNIWRKSFKSEAQGFALDWAKDDSGLLLSGCMRGEVNLHSSKGMIDWFRHEKPYRYHKGSVEEIKFSPNEPHAFMSCSTDGTVQFIDLRVGNLNTSQLSIIASKTDVNVIDWNTRSTHIIASGDDAGVFKVWDLRKAKEQLLKKEIIQFCYHKGPISTIEFMPEEQSWLAVGSEDGVISIWDLAAQNQQENQEFPNELMFLHEGHKEVKQLRFHPIYKELLMSTGDNGLHFFKPSLEGPAPDQKEQNAMELE